MHKDIHYGMCSTEFTLPKEQSDFCPQLLGGNP